MNVRSLITGLSLALIVGSTWAQTVTTSGGATNAIPKFSGNSALTNSAITEVNGNVGIGTSSPAYTLDVSGTIRNTSQANFGESDYSSSSAILTVGDGQYGLSSYGGALYLWEPGGGVQIQHRLTAAGTPGNAVVTGDPLPRPGSLRLRTNTGNSSVVEIGLFDDSPYGGWIQASNGGSYGPYPLSLNPSGGNVGIGTAVPGAKLDVAGNVKLSGSGASITFPDGSTQSTAWNGTLGGGDYAESVDISGNPRGYEPGDVLVIDSKTEGKFLKSVEPYSTNVMGIYSTKPGLTGRRQATAKSLHEVPMAMMGIVPTKVSAENGPIHPGDLLVTSSTPGYAMKGTDRSRLVGALIGKALGSLDSGKGVIEVGITLQ